MLDFSMWKPKRIPVILQGQYFECGLACLAMVASHFGQWVTVSALRERFQISAEGTSFAALTRYAGLLGLNARPIRVELHELALVRCPVILHWEFNHFIVLTRVKRGRFIVHDPALGMRILTQDQVSRSFTGVALEFMPEITLQPRVRPPVVGISKLFSTMHGYRSSLAKLLAVALVLECLNLCAPLMLQISVDTALALGDISPLKTLGVGFAGLVLLRVGFQTLRSWILVFINTSVSLQLVNAMFAKLLRLPIDFFARRTLGDLLSRFDSVNQVKQVLAGNMVEALLDGLMSSLSLLIMFHYSAPLTWVVLGAVVSYWAVRALMYGPYRRLSEEILFHSARQQSHFLETLRGVQSLKLANREAARRSVWQNLLVTSTNAHIERERMLLPFKAANGMIFGTVGIALAIMGAGMINEGSLSVGAFFAFIAYQQQFVARMDSLVARFFEFKMMSLHKERISEIALAPEETRVDENTLSVCQLAGEIRVDNICFRYAQDGRNVLSNISFNVPSGSSLAVVGRSGVGKTTLMKLLIGILRPASGSISIDGFDISGIDIKKLRESVAVVMQEDQLFTGSLRDNISFFDSNASDERIERCARMAAVHDTIQAMPMKYLTLVGDLGNTLSGGQKQRILIARALYREPQVLVLDEATSHLDSETETAVNHAIASLNITRVIIAHRPSTIDSADAVFDLGTGEFVRQCCRPSEDSAAKALQSTGGC